MPPKNKQPIAERNTAASKREVALSILATLLVVFLVNVLILWSDKYFSANRGYRVVIKKWEMLERLSGPVDWLILGDSSGNQGVLPSILKERLGAANAVNLCTMGYLTAMHDAWMLESVIEQSGPPRHVLLVHAFQTWTYDVDLEVMAWIPLEWGFWERLQPSIQLNFKDSLRVFLARYVPLYSRNRTLAETLTSPRTSSRKQRLIIDPDGFMAVREADPENVENHKDRLASFAREQHLTVSDPNRKALFRIGMLADQYGFDVYLADSPIYEGLFSEPGFQEKFRDFQNSLVKLIGSSKRVHYLTRRPVTFSKSQMENAVHVTLNAARIYTNAIVSQLERIASD